MTQILLCLILAACQAIANENYSQLAEPIATAECTEWVDSVYNSLTERERVAQLMVPSVAVDQGDATKSTLKLLVERQRVGGLLFSKGTMAQYAEMINYAQSLAQVPLMITFDGEWGLAMRIPDAPNFPHMQGLGAIRDKQLLYEYGKEMARECSLLGVQVNFAPVMDVNSNPANPVIGYRSLGEDPKRVARLGTAYSLGLEDGGVMAVSKHFPGHGDTSVDSHKALATVYHSVDSLDAIDLVPFKSFIKSGCNGVMVGHIAVPSLDPSLTPASLSHEITTGLLKEKLGFNGLVFTDGLGMRGADSNGNICVNALEAGADVLLCPRNTASDIDAVLAAVANGQIPESEIEARCKKMLAYKYALGLTKKPVVNRATVAAEINSLEADDLIQRLADASVTVVHNKGNALPIGDLGHNTIAVVNLGAPKGNEFDEMCARYAKVDVYDGNALTQATLAEICSHATVVAAVFNDSQQSIYGLQQLSSACRKSSSAFVPVFMVNAFKMAKFRGSLGAEAALAIVYDDLPATRRAAAKGLFGGIAVDGRLPVNVKGIAKVGDGVDLPKVRLGYSSLLGSGLKPALEAQLDSVVNKALAEGAFPGAQLIVARGGNIVIDKCYGKTTKGGEAVTPQTIYDLASVSKTVGTLPGVMKAYDLGLFDIDSAASAYIPGLNVEGKADITPRQLLYHETGLPPSLNSFYLMMDSDSYTGSLISSRYDKNHTIKIYDKCYGNQHARMRRDIASRVADDNFCIEAARGLYLSPAAYDTVMQRIYDVKLKPNRNFLYSCLNFCLLMDLEQRVTGQPHQQWVGDSVWSPIGAYNFCYRPTESHQLSDIAATENDTFLRKQHLRGYVHDELAAFSGGVQGNAGVFGSATDVAKLCQMWLNGGWYGDASVLSQPTTRLFTTDKSPNSHRGLGFDKPNLDNPAKSTTCDEAGPSVYGHTGYTGTVFWVDPENDLIFVFLNNRVDPTRSNAAWSRAAVRPTLMSLIYKALE